MATNARIPQRSSRLPTRGRGDENAVARHVRQQSTGRPSAKDIAAGTKHAPVRPALGEVTLKAVNSKTSATTVGEKDKQPLRSIRGVNGAAPPARVPVRAPLAPAVPNLVNARAQPQPPQAVFGAAHRASRPAPQPIVIYEDDEGEHAQAEDTMDVEEDDVRVRSIHYDDDDDVAVMAVETDKHADGMVVVEESDDEHFTEEGQEEEEEYMHDKPEGNYMWPDVPAKKREQYAQEVAAIREVYDDEPDYDPAMVGEYAEDIFEYMQTLEEQVMPNPDYMDSQNEINWEMRQTLVDWLLQAHLRYHMIPETIWIAVNIVDRFLSKRVVSLSKVQLVGLAAPFIAAKYEEIMAPSVDEFAGLADNGYTREEILKGERIILTTLGFHISHYCSPYSWMRRISRADDYDIQTRTLCKFLAEVTLLDHRFLRVKPSMVAAIGMYTSRAMLGGDWDDAFVFHSGYTEEQLIPGHMWLVEKLNERGFHRNYLVKKYANRKFLKSSTFAIKWARSFFDGSGGAPMSMLSEDQL